MRAHALEEGARIYKGRAILSERAQIVLHAALAFHVSAWQVYLKEIVNDFFQVVANPTHTQYSSLHLIASNLSRSHAAKLNTPNWENSRQLLVETLSFDPYAFWVWSKRHWNAQMVQQRLNEILKIRHSFAHGSSIPVYPWLIGPGGAARLTCGNVRETHLLLANLVRSTDKALHLHIQANYGVTAAWY